MCSLLHYIFVQWVSFPWRYDVLCLFLFFYTSSTRFHNSSPPGMSGQLNLVTASGPNLSRPNNSERSMESTSQTQLYNITFSPGNLLGGLDYHICPSADADPGGGAFGVRPPHFSMTNKKNSQILKCIAQCSYTSPLDLATVVVEREARRDLGHYIRWVIAPDTVACRGPFCSVVSLIVTADIKKIFFWKKSAQFHGDTIAG